MAQQDNHTKPSERNIQTAIGQARSLIADGKECGVAIRVFDDDQVFFSHWFGSAPLIELIESDLNQNPELLDGKNGIFLIRCAGYERPTYGEFGQVELPGGCEVTVEGFWEMDQ